MKKLEVPIIYKGMMNFIVEVPENISNEQAEELAKSKATQMYANGFVPDSLGNEWESFESFGEIKEVK